MWVRLLKYSSFAAPGVVIITLWFLKSTQLPFLVGTSVKGGVKVDQCGGAKGSQDAWWSCVGEGLWSVAEEALAHARRVWRGGARSWACVCFGSV